MRFTKDTLKNFKKFIRLPKSVKYMLYAFDSTFSGKVWVWDNHSIFRFFRKLKPSLKKGLATVTILEDKCFYALWVL